MPLTITVVVTVPDAPSLPLAGGGTEAIAAQMMAATPSAVAIAGLADSSAITLDAVGRNAHTLSADACT